MITEIPRPCESNPCQNGGTCIESGDNEYDCECSDWWTGPTCEDLETTISPRTSGRLHAPICMKMHFWETTYNFMPEICYAFKSKEVWHITFPHIFCRGP